MASRREWRVPFAATIRVVGMSRAGEAYSGTVQTIDISRRGVRVTNAEILTHVGEVVTLRHQHRRAKFRVIWIGGAEGKDHGFAGLTLLEGQAPIWGLDPGTGRADQFNTAKRRSSAPAAPIFQELPPPSPPSVLDQQKTEGDRRNEIRYDCDRSVACWRVGTAVPVWGKLRDVSLVGCGVEVPVAFEPSTALRLVLLVHGIKVRAEGVVRRTVDKVMGVQLTRIHRDDYQKFQAVISHLAQPRGETYVPVNISETMLREIETWFEDRELLSRGELHALLEMAKKRNNGPPQAP